jgi:[ribosomal protein S18]-alanine N-acetyltransferase
MSSEPKIRDFQHTDFMELWEIDQECFPRGISYSQPELLAYIRGPKSFTLVAEDKLTASLDRNMAVDKRIVGFIVAERGSRQGGHIITIDVLPEGRRSGLGSRLLSSAENRLADQGCTWVYLETAVDNTSAVSFYKRHRYFLVKTLPRYYANGVDAFVLKKDLLPAG